MDSFKAAIQKGFRESRCRHERLMQMTEMTEMPWMQRPVRTTYFHHDLTDSSFHSFLKQQESRKLREIVEKVSNKRNLPYFSDHKAYWIIRRIERNKTVK